MIKTDTLKKIKGLLTDREYRMYEYNKFGILNPIPDSFYLRFMFKYNLGYKLNLKHPETFNEKLQWLKIHDRNPEYTKMVDKIQAKEYVANIIGSEHIIPTLGVWDNPDDIDYDKLPEQFVLKCNHNSGLGMYICKDKSTMDIKAVNDGLKKGLKENYFYSGREWPYKNVKKKIFAEQYIGSNLTDYRVYCFNGVPKMIYVYKNAESENCEKPEISSCDIFDCDWNAMPFHQKSLPCGNAEKPFFLNEILEYSKLLSKGTCFLRCDFYYTDRIYAGELTFFPGTGFSPFFGEEWDGIIGGWLKLPE